ncbi:MAG: hypothetical protein A2V66_02310 [Ignavibacteria bacterium RBG_13_36_8]|nr:MAG: hypothetical protein A2V66_02310 [Ignavibacteria bacterium RBG_13_36_8]
MQLPNVKNDSIDLIYTTEVQIYNELILLEDESLLTEKTFCRRLYKNENNIEIFFYYRINNSPKIDFKLQNN